MANLVLFDLDLEEDLRKIYQDAKDTIAYLEDIVKSIETRVLDGEHIRGLKIVTGRKTRFITDEGFIYLAKILGKDKVYELVEKPITLTKLEALIGEKETAKLEGLGYIQNKFASNKVVVE